MGWTWTRLKLGRGRNQHARPFAGSGEAVVLVASTIDIQATIQFPMAALRDSVVVKSVLSLEAYPWSPGLLTAVVRQAPGFRNSQGHRTQSASQSVLSLETLLGPAEGGWGSPATGRG